MITVPYFRPSIGEAEINEVVATLQSGWLTTGPKTKEFESEFSRAVRAKNALAVNSCTAALHLAVEALRLNAGDAVLVPTLTFAATAEVIRYQGAHPVLVDCDPVTLNMDMEDAGRKVEELKMGRLPVPAGGRLVGIIPVHVGGLMMDVDAVLAFAERHGLWVVEDAAHAFPAAWRKDSSSPWRYCGEDTSSATCFSFYANKTITTGEGGMVVTKHTELYDRMRIMALHGLSRDAWARYSGGGSWDYQIVAPGFKYNLTDIAAAVGVQQLARAEAMRCEREQVAVRYIESLGSLDELEMPSTSQNRIHAWHLFPIRLCLEKLTINRNQFVDALRQSGIGFSVHWRPLHLHPYYESYGWHPDHCPFAGKTWTRLVSLPIFPGMTTEEQNHVIETIKSLCAAHKK